MTKRLVSLLLPALVGCAMAPKDPTAAGAADGAENGSQRAAPADAAASRSSSRPVGSQQADARQVNAQSSRALAQTGDATSKSPRRAPLSVKELWSDPEFVRDFKTQMISTADIEPTVPFELAEIVQEAQALLGKEQTAAAIQLLKENESKDSAFLDCMLGGIHFQRDEVPLAIRAFQSAVDKHPRFRRAWTMLGRCYYQQQDHANAIQAFSKVIENGGQSALVSGLLGVCHSRRSDHVAAAFAFQQAAALQPFEKKWKLGLAESLLKQGSYAEATAHFGRMLEETPDDAALWNLKGEAYAMLKQQMKAAYCFEMADRLGGSTLATLSNLGDIYANQGLFDLAVGAYARSLKDPKAKADRPIRTAKYLSQAGGRDASETLIQAIRQSFGERLTKKQTLELLRLDARIALARGASEKEAEVLAEIVRLDPLDGEGLLLLGQYHARKGDAVQAIHFYERAADIEKFKPDANLLHAQLLVGQTKYGPALTLLRAAQEAKFRPLVQDFLVQVERAARNR